jgi:hypothetical protein
MLHKYQTQMRLTKLLQTIHNLSIYWNKFRPDILLSCMRHFAMFFFLRSCFLILENRSQTKIWIFIRTFLVLLFSVRIVVEYVKESQGGFESTLDYFQQVNGLVYHYNRTVFYFHSWKPVKFRSCLKVISKSDIKKASGTEAFLFYLFSEKWDLNFIKIKSSGHLITSQ